MGKCSKCYRTNCVCKTTCYVSSCEPRNPCGKCKKCCNKPRDRCNKSNPCGNCYQCCNTKCYPYNPCNSCYKCCGKNYSSNSCYQSYSSYSSCCPSRPCGDCVQCCPVQNACNPCGNPWLPTPCAAPCNTTSVPLGTYPSDYLYWDGSCWKVGSNTIRLGAYAGSTGQGTNSVALGSSAGRQSQGTGAVAVGYQAGQTNQGTNAVAVGFMAVAENQQSGAVALGPNAAAASQGANAIAIGNTAAGANQASGAVAIGNAAAGATQGLNAIALGTSAAGANQGAGAVAIGNTAASASQGANAIAIGNNAAGANQTAGSIVLNASGSSLAAAAAGYYVNPVRNGGDGAATNQLWYNTSTFEISYDTTKTFVVEHPLETSRFLVHACIEGPESAVFYRGRARTEKNEDSSSSCEVSLPAYAAALADNFSVQVTPVGLSVLFSTSEVVNGKFEVCTSYPCEFFWQATGRRGEVNVEPLKSEVTVRGDGPYKYISHA